MADYLRSPSGQTIDSAAGMLPPLPSAAALHDFIDAVCHHDDTKPKPVTKRDFRRLAASYHPACDDVRQKYCSRQQVGPHTTMLEALFELVARFLVEFLFYTVLYGVGWIMLKSITLGRYPPPPPSKHNEELVALFPVVTLFVGLTFAFS